MNYLNLNDSKNYYVLIKINNNIDIDLVNNKVQVIGIFSSRRLAEEKINGLSLSIALSNLIPKYIIQGPFSIDKPQSDTINSTLLPLQIGGHPLTPILMGSNGFLNGF